MHYVVFLMHHGMAPYRDIVDINMPGSYIVSLAVEKIFGASALGFRLFDFLLCIAATGAMIAIASSEDRLAGLYAGVLLFVIHGRDGVAQTGERDLIMASLLLLAYAFLFHALRRKVDGAMFWFGLCAGAAATIKPTVLPFAPLLLLLTCISLRRREIPAARFLLYGVVGFLVPLIGVLLWLLREHAVGAFFGILFGLVRYHASLHHLPLGYLLNHSFSPLAMLLALWVLLLAWQRPRLGWEPMALGAGILFGLVSYVVQAKGYPYHRYPLLAFLLLAIAMDFFRALGTQGWPRRLGVAGLAYGSLVILPVSLWKIHRFIPQNMEYTDMLAGDLRLLGGNRLNGRVQCMDTFAGCIATLDQMQLVQSTGYIYDCYFYAPARPTPAAEVVVERMRAGFWQAIERRTPEVFVVSNQWCLNGPGGYGKLERWPEFQAWLMANYRVAAERTPPDWLRWTYHATPPFSYRIYVRKPG